jgi:peptidoglycan-associated lipoprotein
MTRTRTVSLVAAAVLATAMFSSCKAKPPKTAIEARDTSAPRPSTPTEVAVAPPPAPRESDVLSGDLGELNRRGYLKNAYFDYDKADLRDDARAALTDDARWLKRYASTQILVEGHCDERGTEEYNLALGDRRANVVREYLASLGVGPNRVKTVSYGKDRPLCNEETESCWQQNRQGHLVITAK